MPEERKLVTVLFTDTTGSTTLGETLDPEDVRALMAGYYAHAQRIIAAHGGTVEKFIGDAVMAVFGLPQAHGNDAERALAAALAIREAIASDPVLGARIALHMGVNTGPVIATADPSSGDFLVTGDAVNVAARLYDAASPGEILVGERTQVAAQTAFLFGETRELRLKNKALPLRAAPLLGRRPTRQMSRPPFLGRRQELLQLAALAGRALEDQRPQLVTILAPAGTGKTRLLEEFLARVDPLDGFEVITARCLPYGQTLTYWPLRGFLEQALGGAIARERLVAVFTGGGYASDDAARLSDLILTTLGVEREGSREGSAERESIFAAWRLLVESLAARAPRIIVFEDLHWASESLLDLVEHVMSQRTNAALLILALSRPELLDRRPAWGGGRRNFTALTLEPLKLAQTQELVKQLAEGMPEDARDQIVERCGGNPFFAIELARTLASRSARGEATTFDALPDTIQEAVQARLDQLAPEEREAFQVAAVAGRAFRPETIDALLPQRSATEVATLLDDLTARDLITPVEGGAYTFRHILFRDVAYGGLARAERIRLHGAMAAWLEAYATDRLDEFVELIAYHYREAALLARQAVVPLALPVDPANAVRYLELAGERAQQAGAFVEARNYLQSAIALASGREQARLNELLGDYTVWVFQDISEQAHQAALDYWRSLEHDAPGATAAMSRLMSKLILFHLFSGNFSIQPDVAEMTAKRREARLLAEASGDEEEIWRTRLTDLYW